jgi:hypothetical protein
VHNFMLHPSKLFRETGNIVGFFYFHEDWRSNNLVYIQVWNARLGVFWPSQSRVKNVKNRLFGVRREPISRRSIREPRSEFAETSVIKRLPHLVWYFSHLNLHLKLFHVQVHYQFCFKLGEEEFWF